MAQRTIHALFCERICRELDLQDPERFLFGMLLPDAAEPGQRDITHYKVRTAERVYYDFARFREEFAQEMEQDELYLGYYLHLVEDALYRMFVYAPRFRMPKTAEEIAVLHRDYRILNAHIIQAYGLQSRLTRQIDIKGSPLLRMADFRTEELTAEFARDFTDKPAGEAHFLTEKMLEEFLETAVPAVIEEAKRWKNGGTLFTPQDFSWARRR